MIKFILMTVTLMKTASLELDEMSVATETTTKIVVSSRALCCTKNLLKRIISFLYEYKTSKKEFLKIGDVEIKKKEFHCSKCLISIGFVNIDKIVISGEFSCAKKGSEYFVNYNNNEDVTLLCLAPKNEQVSKMFL